MSCHLFHPLSRRRAPAVAVALLAALAPLPGRAQLLVSPSAGAVFGAAQTDLTPLLSDPDDGVVVRPFGSSFTFYGRPQTLLAITTNGYVQLGGDAWYVRSAARTLPELAEALGAPVVAPLYDDLVFDGGSALLEAVAPDHFQAYTYRDVLGFGGDPGAGGRSTFQVAFFTGVTRIGAFDFLAGDVAFSYGVLGHTPAADAVTAGLARDGLAYTAHPGASGADGTVAGPAGLTAAGARTVVFRPNGAGGYDASVVPAEAPAVEPPVTTTPEPPAAVCVAVGLAVAAAVARRRRSA